MLDRLAKGETIAESPTQAAAAVRPKGRQNPSPPAMPFVPAGVDVAGLGDAIRQARTVAGLSQIGLAAKLETSQANVVRLEKGRSQPKTGTLQKIANATGHRLAIAFVPLPKAQASTRSRRRKKS
jgi:ribosome-binding protein aMBF1 (putative translation factor)